MFMENNQLVIKEWMVNDLKLKGNNLLVYALIYNKDTFNESLETLQKWTNSTRQGIIGTLKVLIRNGLIIKERKFPNNIYKINKYLIESFEV